MCTQRHFHATRRGSRPLWVDDGNITTGDGYSTHTLANSRRYIDAVDPANQARFTFTLNDMNATKRFTYIEAIVRAGHATDANSNRSGLYKIKIYGLHDMGSAVYYDYTLEMITTKETWADWVAISAGDIAVNSASATSITVDFDNPSSIAYDYDAILLHGVNVASWTATSVSA